MNDQQAYYVQFAGREISLDEASFEKAVKGGSIQMGSMVKLPGSPEYQPFSEELITKHKEQQELAKLEGCRDSFKSCLLYPLGIVGMIGIAIMNSSSPETKNELNKLNNSSSDAFFLIITIPLGLVLLGFFIYLYVIPFTQKKIKEWENNS